MRPVPAVLADAAVSAGWGTVVGWVACRLPQSRFAVDGPVTHIRAWERGGLIWERTGVRRWKTRMPELGALFGGISKRRIPGSGAPGLDRLAIETRRAELVHWAAGAPILVMPLWNPAGITTAMVVYAIAANAPFIVIQRFNRARVIRIAGIRRGRNVAQ